MNRHLRPMNGAQPVCSILFAFVLIVVLSSAITIALGQSISRATYQLESDDAFPDSTLPANVPDYFEDSNTSPLCSIRIDLNGDGRLERLVPNKFLEGTGYCPWLIFDPSCRNLIGRVDAKVIFVLDSLRRGYNVLQCYCRLGGGIGEVTTYVFNGTKYTKSKTLRLEDEQIDAFFNERSKVPHPKVLRPVK